MERKILGLLGRGWSNAQLGRELNISPHTVRGHVRSIMVKLHFRKKLEAYTFAIRARASGAL